MSISSGRIVGVPAVVDDRGALVIGGQPGGEREGVGQRQEQVGRLVSGDERDLLDHLAHAHGVGVGEDHALGRSGGARGVDDRVGVLGGDAGLAPSSSARSRPRPRERSSSSDRSPPPPSIDTTTPSRASRRAPRRSWRSGRRSRTPPPWRPSCRVPRRTPGASWWGRRGRRPTGRRDAVTGQRPLQSRVGQDADPVAGLDPQVSDSERHLADGADDLVVGELLPFAVDAMARRQMITEPLRRGAGQGRDGGGNRTGALSHGVLLLGAATGVLPSQGS